MGGSGSGRGRGLDVGVGVGVRIEMCIFSMILSRLCFGGKVSRASLVRGREEKCGKIAKGDSVYQVLQ